MSSTSFLRLLAVTLLLALFIAGCSSDDPEEFTAPEAPKVATCEGCHTNQEMLVATALPDPPPPEEAGEG